MLDKIPAKLKSRKLFALIGLVVLVVCNYFFNLGMPPADVLYLVILGTGYILGQGYVDAKQQPVKDFPVDDVTQSVSNIIQTELAKLDFGKNVPMEKIIEELTPIMKTVLGSFTLAPVITTASKPNPEPSMDPTPETAETV